MTLQDEVHDYVHVSLLPITAAQAISLTFCQSIISTDTLGGSKSVVLAAWLALFQV